MSRARRLALALALTCASGPAWDAAPPDARAADDAGTRSVFAIGAGNRALAMGGAFAAIADDASAPLWNPAGLGGMTQGELQISQAELEFGFHESFAGLAIPDWRWGAAALTLRYFGTSGIEGRDDRNVLVSDGLSSSESEVAVAVGKTLGPAWSIGASAKLRRQDVAGTSGTGVGADLGVRVRPGVALGLAQPWAQQVRFGLALRNALEPAIRLDRESVADPSALRLGLAFDQPLFNLGGLLASFDLEKTRGAQAHAHAGLELRPTPMFALRTGLNQGTLTAGTALRFGRAELEYAFEDQAVGATHRAGLTYRLGPTTSEARDRAARAEEERLNQRLAEVEKQRESERLDALLARAEEARARNDLDQAQSLVSTARVLDPDHARAKLLEASLLSDRGHALEAAGDPAGAAVAYRQALSITPGDAPLAAALERSRRESDLRAARSAEIRRKFDTALDAFAADNLPAARSGFAAILAANPRDSEARTMLDRVDGAIARRADDWIRRANLLAQAGDFREAEATLARARELAPRAPGLDAASAALERQRQGLAAESARRASEERSRATSRIPAQPSAQLERDLAEYYRRGQVALEAGRSDEALRYWELVWAIRPGYQRVDDYLKREYLTRGMEQFAAGRLLESISLWERALKVDPKDERALGYLARAHEQLDRARAIAGEGP